MQIWKKIILGTFTGAVSCTALYCGILIAVPDIVDLNKYKTSFSEAVQKETGFKVLCENIEFKKSLTPYLKIHMYHTLIFYPDDEVFLKLKEADLKVKILPLLFKKIVIKDAQLHRPIINITLYKDFSTSLEKFIDTSKIVNTNGFRLDAFINDSVFENYKIKFKDDSINKTFYLEGGKLIIKDLKPHDRARVILKGSVFEGGKEYIKYDIDVVSALNSQKVKLSFSPFKPVFESDIKGSIFGHLKVDKENNINGNLKIDDLSLKVEDAICSNNMADLIFKGKEVEINSVIHTSKTDSAKVKGKFNFGKKKYINLNTNAENIKIENLVKIVSEISKILNVKNPLHEINIKGLLDADFSINSDFKKLKSSGKVQIINASLKHNSLPYFVSDMNAHINLDNNKISIQKADANINQTPVNIKGIVNENVSFNINISSGDLKIADIINSFDLGKKLPFSVSNGFLSFNADITGVPDKSYNMKSKINLTNLNMKDKKYNIPVSLKSVEIDFNGNDKKYKGEILSNNVNLKYFGQNIAAEKINFVFDQNKITIPENNLLAPLELKISGNIKDYNKKPEGNINFSGNILSSFAADILKSEIKLPYKASGKIKSEGKIDFSTDKTNIKAQFGADENNYLSYVVIKELLKKTSVLNMDCDITENTINIKDLSLSENTKAEKNSAVILASGSVKNDKNPILKNLKITIPESLTAATNFFGGEEISLKADILLNKTLNNPEIKGNAKILKYNLKKYFTSFKNADVSFNNDNIRIIAPDVNVNDSSFNIIADVKPLSSDKNITVSNLQINSMNLDLNTFFDMIQKRINPSSQSLISVKKGIVTVNNLKVLDLKARDISSDIQIENNIVKLSDIAASAYNGTIKGRINYDLAASSLDVNMIGEGVDIKTSLYDLCKFQDGLEGKSDFEAKVSMITGSYNEVIKSLNGNVKFNAYNGRMGTLGKFEYYLYAQNLLYHGILNATLNRIADAVVRDNTAQYKRSSGSFLFQNGYMLTEGIETVGTNMSLYIRGRHNLITNQANIDIFGRISDDVKYKLGSFGNTSISGMINSQGDKKKTVFTVIPDGIVSKIPDLYNQKDGKSNIFKVNIYGNVNSLNSINSFEWIVSDNNRTEEIKELPDSSDMIQDL